MEPNRKDILDKTHYGLNIYAHVLRQYYPGETVLSLSGRDCETVKNPFNGNKRTLKISIVNNCAEHYDLENNANKGDAFSFAALYYKLEEQALYNKLNEAMYLRIGEAFDFYKRQGVLVQQPPPSVVKPAISCFSYFKCPVTNTVPEKQINLLEVYRLVRGNSFITETHTLREIQDCKKAKEYKARHFDYVTFSGIFSRRTDKDLQIHSGLLTIDFDHLENAELLKAQLLNDEYFETELMFLSPSGDGVKWIVPVDLAKATHQQYFGSISNYILHTYQLKIDSSGKDISRACFLPHDAGIYINPKYL